VKLDFEALLRLPRLVVECITGEITGSGWRLLFPPLPKT